MSNLFTTTLRINLTKPEGRKAWVYLQYLHAHAGEKLAKKLLVAFE